MAGDDTVIGVENVRHVEHEAQDALGDLPDLFGRVPPRVARIGFELVDPAVNDFDRVIDARLFLASPSQFSLLLSAFIWRSARDRRPPMPDIAARYCSASIISGVEASGGRAVAPGQFPQEAGHFAFQCFF